MKPITARHYQSKQLIHISYGHGRILDIVSLPDSLDQGYWITPAFFDLQINGCAGVSFTDRELTEPQVRQVVERCRKHGIGNMLATIITSPESTIVTSLKSIMEAREDDQTIERTIIGFHIEGPWISPVDGPRGAHPKTHVRAPDWNEFCRWQEAARGNIKLVTLAPEQPGAIPIIEKLVSQGVAVAIGHTAAEPWLIREVVSAGATLSTHLGNGCHRMLHRHENILWEQLSDDRLMISLITDGHHLPPTVVKNFIRMKSQQRVIITCDSSGLAGMPPGKYRFWEHDLEVLPEGKIILPSQGVLAGSWAFTDRCVEIAMRSAGMSLAETIAMVHDHPRKLLGLPCPTIQKGQPSQFAIFKKDKQGEMKFHEAVYG